MNQRMTVVFDDPDVAKRLKIWAAEHDMTLKQVIEDAVRAYLGPPPEEKPFDWDAFDRWQEEAEARDREHPPATPVDLSDVKKHLYRAGPERYLAVAEEAESYGQ